MITSIDAEKKCLIKFNILSWCKNKQTNKETLTNVDIEGTKNKAGDVTLPDYANIYNY